MHGERWKIPLIKVLSFSFFITICLVSVKIAFFNPAPVAVYRVHIIKKKLRVNERRRRQIEKRWKRTKTIFTLVFFFFFYNWNENVFFFVRDPWLVFLLHLLFTLRQTVMLSYLSIYNRLSFFFLLQLKLTLCIFSLCN